MPTSLILMRGAEMKHRFCEAKHRFYGEARDCIEICSNLHDNQERIEKWLEWFYEKAWDMGFEAGREDARTDRF